MIRPEVKALFWRWREVLFALAVVGLGLWWGLRSFGILQWLGWAVSAAGAMLAVSAIQRGRFGKGGDGPGVVTIDERRIIYMGPTDGGVADLDLTVRLDLTPASAWRLTGETGEQIEIPVNAAGAEALFDAFSTLPGLRSHTLVSVLNEPRDTVVTIWRKPRDSTVTQLPPRLH